MARQSGMLHVNSSVTDHPRNKAPMKAYSSLKSLPHVYTFILVRIIEIEISKYE